MGRSSEKGVIHLALVFIVLVAIGVVAYFVIRQGVIPKSTEQETTESTDHQSGSFDISNLFNQNITGPGGCKGPDCEAFCSKNPQECQKWCMENQELCAQLMGGGTNEKVADPPKTQISFSKSLNLIAGVSQREDILAAKRLGANVVTIWPTTLYQNNSFSFFPQQGNVSGLISEAHKQGLQVELRTSYPVGAKVTNYQAFKTSALEFVKQYAEFGQKNKVYRIIPFGEVDNYLLGYEGNIDSFTSEILSEMRKNYSGKIGIGIAAPWRGTNYKFSGYDYMSVSAYPQTQTSALDWLTETPQINVHSVVSSARKVADASGISDLVLGETGVFNQGEVDQYGFEAAIVSKGEEADFYNTLFNVAAEKLQGVAVFYGSPIMGIKNDPAEQTVNSWFEKL